MIPFGQLKSELRAVIFPAGEADNLVAAHDRMFVDALIDLQRFIDCRQENHTTIYPFCGTFFECGRTVIVTPPKGVIKRIKTIANANWCDFVDYNQREFADVENWSRNLLLYTQPPLLPGLPSIPEGFRYANASTDAVCGRSRNGIWALNRKRIYIVPWIQSNEQVLVEWDGIKRDWADADLVDASEDTQLAIQFFVRMSNSRDFDGDEKRALFYKSEYENTRADLIFDCREETRVRKRLISHDVEERPPTADEITAESVPAVTGTEIFANIGDYGTPGAGVDGVAGLIKSWNPAYIVTNGDNWYESGTAVDTLDNVTGLYFASFLFPYKGTRGPSSATIQNFYPCIGNHDRDPVGRLAVEQDYFTLAKPYYEFVRGHVHFFMVDSGYDNSQVNQQPDGVDVNSVQAQWLRVRLAFSTARWKVVVIHHPPYTSTTSVLVGPPAAGDGTLSYTALRWPFKAWGADLVFNGHAHNYERLQGPDGTPYIINGAGGQSGNSDEFASFTTPSPYSIVRYNSDYGAVRGTVACNSLKLEFINRSGTVIDTLTLSKT